MADVAAAAIETLLATSTVALIVAGRRRRLRNASALFCFVSLTAVTVMTLELAAHGAALWLSLVGTASSAAVFLAWFGILFRGRPGDGEDPDDGRGGPGVGGDDGRGPGPAGSEEPSWWGEFEREMRAYMRASEQSGPGRSLRP